MATFAERSTGALAPLRRRPGALVGIGAGVAAVLAVLALFIYDSTRSDVIANGVKIGGTQVGGLSRAEALRVVRGQTAHLLARKVTIHFGGRAWQLTPRAAGVRVDTARTVSEAVAAGRGGFFLTRAVRELTGGSVSRDVPLHVSYSHRAVRALAARIAATLNQPPRDASVQVVGSALTTAPSHRGVTVRVPVLRRRIAHALVAATGPRVVAIPVLRPRPHVTVSMLASRYPAYIVVDRSGFTLRYYNHLRLANSYPIAVGMQGLETPGGLYHIQWKQVDPPWYVPNSPWAGSLAGQTIPPGPQDPLKARFMSFDGGAGIHGIDPSEYGTIGHAASHGCIRMTIPDVIQLYSKTPVGTPVYIV